LDYTWDWRNRLASAERTGSPRIATGSHSEQRGFIGEEFDGDTESSYLNTRIVRA
jgi:hypothetical protein